VSEQVITHGSQSRLTEDKKAKWQRYTGDNASAIATLQRGLGPERQNHFKQADVMLLFELAWILLAERRYEESAQTFLRLLDLNSWFVHSNAATLIRYNADFFSRSFATYSYLAAGMNNCLFDCPMID